MAKLIDVMGVRFGRLVVVEKCSPDKGFKSTGARWKCLCDCGNLSIVSSAALRSGATNSCGCFNEENKVKHGMYGTPTYRSWTGMIARCGNPRAPNFHLYGGIGIKVCQRWREFALFFEDMGVRPSGTTLDRIDVNGNYEPGNCRWAGAVDQQRNKRNNHVLTVNGESQCISAWAERVGISKMTIRARIRLGWSHEQAVLTPLHQPRA